MAYLVLDCYYEDGSIVGILGSYSTKSNAIKAIDDYLEHNGNDWGDYSEGDVYARGNYSTTLKTQQFELNGDTSGKHYILIGGYEWDDKMVLHGVYNSNSSACEAVEAFKVSSGITNLVRESDDMYECSSWTCEGEPRDGYLLSVMTKDINLPLEPPYNLIII